MSVTVVDKMTEDFRYEIHKALKELVESIPVGHQVSIKAHRGVDSFHYAGDQVERSRINGTVTIEILVNGGARDADLGMALRSKDIPADLTGTENLLVIEEEG